MSTKEIFRSLENYKKMHESTAKQKGVSKELQNAGTLTQARKIVFGVKSGQRGLKK
jgi:hypothetical protein